MDFRWDHGFVTDKYDYLEQRIALQQEQLTPIPDDDLAMQSIGCPTLQNTGRTLEITPMNGSVYSN